MRNNTRAWRCVGWLGLLVAGFAASACGRGLELESPEQAAKAMDRPGPAYGGYLAMVEVAETKPDMLSRCLAFPLVIGNKWRAGEREAHCALSWGSGITPQRMDGLLASGKVAELDSIYAADQARHQSQDKFSEAIHGDFYFFDGGAESDRMSRRWKELAPSSPFARLARGNHLLNAARRVRDARSESIMEPAEIARMRDLGAESIAEFDAAASFDPQQIEAYVGLAHVGRIASIEAAEERGITEGEKVDPLCAALAVQHMWGVSPRWGGSYLKMAHLKWKLEGSLEERPLLSLAVVMPEFERATEYGEAEPDRDWRKRMGDMLRPLAVATTSPDVSEYMGIASCCEAGRPRLESAMHFVAASQFRRDSTYFAFNRGATLRDQGYNKLAIPDLMYVIAREPHHGPAHYNLGTVYYNQFKYADSERELLLGMEDKTSRAPALMVLVQTLAKAGRLEEARQRAEQYHREYPQYEQDWPWLQDFLAKEEAEHKGQP